MAKAKDDKILMATRPRGPSDTDAIAFELNDHEGREVRRSQLPALQSFLDLYSTSAGNLAPRARDDYLALRLFASGWSASGVRRCWLGALWSRNDTLMASWMLHRSQPFRGSWNLSMWVVHPDLSLSAARCAHDAVTDWVMGHGCRWLWASVPQHAPSVCRSLADLGYVDNAADARLALPDSEQPMGSGATMIKPILQTAEEWSQRSAKVANGWGR